MADKIPPSQSIDWTDDQPDPDRKWYKIISVKPRERLSSIIISRKVVGVYTHWIDAGTQPHMKNEKLCQGCRMNIRKAWKGYLGVLWGLSGNITLLEVTPECVRLCPALQGKTDLRGMNIVVFRRGVQRNSPMQAEVTRMNQIKGLPPEFDLRFHLCRLWGLAPDHFSEEQ